MSERFGGWFPVLLLIVLAGVTFWLDRVVQPPPGAGPRAPRTDPDYVVDGLAAVHMDRQGRVKHTLKAQRMTHFSDDDMTLLTEPNFVTYAEDQAPVTVTARRARMSGNGDHVYFEDDVRVVRSAAGERGPLVLETQYLHVIPDQNVAKTDRAVTIRDGAGVVSATGMELNSQSRVLKLEGRVKGIFDGKRS